MKQLYCPNCNEYLEGGDGELKDCICGWTQPFIKECYRWIYCPKCDEEYYIPENKEICPFCSNEDIEEI